MNDTLYALQDIDNIKPSLNIHCSFSYHHPDIGIHFKIDKNDDVYYYSFDDVYDFIVNNKIPQHHLSPSIYSYPLKEDKVEEIISMNFSVFENIDNDHNNLLVFTNKSKNRYWENESFCKYLFPNLDMRFGAGWKLTGEGTLFSKDTERNFSYLDTDISLKIQKYLLKPEIFIADVNIAIKKQEEKEQQNRVIIQKARSERLKNSLVKYSLPTKNDVFFIEYKNRFYLFDKRFIDKYSLDRGLKYVNNLIFPLSEKKTQSLVKNSSSSEDILKEFFSVSYLKEWSSYIFEVSLQYDLPFYSNDLTSWGDIYSHSSDREKYLKELLPEELNKSLDSSYKSSFVPVDLSELLDNDIDYSKHTVIDNLKNNSKSIDIEKAHLETSIDVSDFLDENEIPFDFFTYHKQTDEDTSLYKSKILDFDCFVFESMGEKTLFIKYSELNNFKKQFSLIKGNIKNTHKSINK